MIEKLGSIIEQALVEVNAHMSCCLQSEDELIMQINQHTLQRQGKQLRPRLVLLVANALSHRMNPKTYRGAALVSLLHHASLLHDDVVDHALYRRNVSTVNSLWGNKMAILLGDYVLSSALQMATEKADHDYLVVLSSTARLMSEGEMLQLKHAKAGANSETVYLQIIQKKTASLLAASCAMGAISVSVHQTTINALYEAGLQWGMAFQLRDDLLDYGLGSDSGKPSFVDLNASILTLPLIYALDKAPKRAAETVKSLFISVAEAPMTEERAQEILTFVSRWGGIEYTLQKAVAYQKEAISLFEKHISASDDKGTLLDFLHMSLPLKSL